MKKEKKHHVIIGTIGHVNHGKTSLTKAIHDTLNGKLTNDYESLYSDGSGHGITINTQTKPKTTLSQQLLEDYQRQKREEEAKWLEETGYYDALIEKYKKQPILIETPDEKE